MEFIFTEDSYYQLAGYGPGLQDVADMIHFCLHCVVKAVCGQTTKPLFLVLRCQLAEECCKEPLHPRPWLLVAHGSSLVLTLYSNISDRLRPSGSDVTRRFSPSVTMDPGWCSVFQGPKA